MKIEFLDTFVKVVEKGSIKGAAEEMNLSLSTVSFQINSVENFYGVKLMDRGGKGITLTEEGNIALKNINSILKEVEQTKNLISKEKNSITISSGMVGIDLTSILQTLLKAKYPHLEILTVLKGAHACYNMVREGTVDFAIGGDLPLDYNKNSYWVEEVGKDRLVLITPPGHEFYKKDEVYMEDVVKQPIVCLTKDYGIRTSVMKAIEENGCVNEEDLDCIFVDDFFTLLHLVSSGKRIAITSLFACLKPYEVGMIKVIGVDDLEDERNIYFVSSMLSMESEKMKEYADLIIGHARKHYEGYGQRAAKILKA